MKVFLMSLFFFCYIFSIGLCLGPFIAPDSGGGGMGFCSKSLPHGVLCPIKCRRKGNKETTMIIREEIALIQSRLTAMLTFLIARR